MPTSHILALTLTKHSFSAAYTYMTAAYHSLLETSSTHFGLGLDHLYVDDADCGFCPSKMDPDSFWTRTLGIILQTGRTSTRPLTTVLLLGEAADDSEFKRTVQEALRMLLSKQSAMSSLQISVSREAFDPVYLAATDAAEFAKRALEAPAGCREPARCADNRRDRGDLLRGDNDQVPLRAGEP